MTQNYPENELANVCCPVCKIMVPKVQAFSDGERDFMVCSSCGIVFRQRLPSASELEAIYAVHYDEANIACGLTEQESGDFALRAYARFIGQVVSPRMNRVLDFGAGTGMFVELMRASGFSAQGLEFSMKARKSCMNLRGFSLLADRDHLAKNDYDFVTMIEVIEHLPSLIDDLKSIQESLREGGMLFVTTPNRRGLRARLQKGYWTEARKKFHLSLFDSESLKNVLMKAGFSRIDAIRFSPIQKPGFHYFLYGRLCQCFGVAGTLCVIAHK